MTDQNLTEEHKRQIAKIGKKYNLDMIVLYGSYAKKTANIKSDLDLAIYRQNGISPDEYFSIYMEISHFLKGFDTDVKALQDTNPLFRFFVTNDGVLLYGDQLLFAEIKANAYQAYQDSYSLFELEKALSQKTINSLLKRYA